MNHPVERLSQGEVVISFDLELGWGSIENNKWRYLEAEGVFETLRQTLSHLLMEMDNLDIAATWGVVGCLVCPPSQRDLSHLPVPVRDKIDAAISVAKPSTFYGHDLVDMIAMSNTDHNFCSHTYSHIRFGHPLVTSDVISADLARFRASLPTDLAYSEILIFPQNQEGFYDEVSRDGYQLVRGKSSLPHDALTQKLFRLVSPPPLSLQDEVIPGLWRETESILFNSGQRRWKLPFVQRRTAMGLQSVADHGGVMHIWTHPFDLAAEPDTFQAFVELLRTIAELREASKLAVRTMGPSVGPIAC